VTWVTIGCRLYLARYDLIVEVLSRGDFDHAVHGDVKSMAFSVKVTETDDRGVSKFDEVT
jgi:hypothetical protein